MRVRYKGRVIEVPVRKLGKWEMGLGLMFRTKETGNLLFEFYSSKKWAIHSYFVFFDFLAVWMDGERVVDCKIVKPFTLSVAPKEKFNRLIEIPVNAKNKKIIKSFLAT